MTSLANQTALFHTNHSNTTLKLVNNIKSWAVQLYNIGPKLQTTITNWLKTKEKKVIAPSFFFAQGELIGTLKA